MLTHLAIALLGAGIFLRVVAKEKNRRQRHLLLRVAQREQALAEGSGAAPAQELTDADPEAQVPYEATAVGEAA